MWDAINVQVAKEVLRSCVRRGVTLGVAWASTKFSAYHLGNLDQAALTLLVYSALGTARDAAALKYPSLAPYLK
jgi:hypothetical protein